MLGKQVYVYVLNNLMFSWWGQIFPRSNELLFIPQR